MTSSSVDAVAICSPSAEHEAQVRCALEADCDVVVEFPVALEPVAAQALFSLAQRQERLLHVEHIELLAPWHQALRQRIGRPKHVRVIMTKPGNGRETPDYFFGAALARLHCIAEYSPIQRIRQRWLEPGCPCRARPMGEQACLPRVRALSAASRST